MSGFSLFGWYWDWQDGTMHAVAEQDRRIQERKHQEQAGLDRTMTYEEGDFTVTELKVEPVASPIRELYIAPDQLTAYSLCKQLGGTFSDIHLDVHDLPALDVDWRKVTLNVANSFPSTMDSFKIDETRRIMVLLVSRGMLIKRWVNHSGQWVVVR